MEDDRRGKNLMTATAAEANPSHHFDRRLKIKGGVDSISCLPDEILHQILSLIPTKLAITTSVLSKRWKHVWCETPCLYFPRLKSSSGSISKTLASYSAAKITSFRLRTRVSNTKRAQLVNSLIEFAMSHNVETLSLKFRYSNSMSYNLPDFLFSNSSLKQLTVDAGFCLISLRCTVSWTSLRSLSLISVQISAESLSRMLSGCPMLESLTLVYWGSVEYLDLSKTLCLRKLDIDLTSWALGTMQIVAPHIYSLRLRTLRFFNDQAQSNCPLVDVSSLTEANIDFGKFLPKTWLETRTSKAASIHTMVQTILEKLQNVENLTLGVSFLQMLSIAEFRGVPFATFKVKTLTLETMILRSVVPGLARLLQNSPGLKKIILYSVDCFTEVDNYVNRYLDKQNLNSGQCWRLKDEVSPDSWECGFAEPKLVGSFVELLLANTRTLEALVLRLGRYFDRSRLRELSEITRTLSADNNVSIMSETILFHVTSACFS